MCRQPSPTPGPTGCNLDQSGRVVSRMSSGEKLREAILRARYHLSPEVSAKLMELVTPEALAILAGTATLWAAGHFFGVSEFVDVVLVGLGVYALGGEAITAGKELTGFVTGALNAKSDSDLDTAGKHLARFVTIVGVDVAIAVLLHKTLGRKSGGKAAVEKPLPEVVNLTAELKVEVRSDISLSGAGRSGENVKFLTGPPNSAVKSAGSGRVFVTDAKGQVILDITAERVKPVRPQIGFGEKRVPTPEELNLIKRLWGK
ncbi:MAG: hypothetical protein WBP93_18780 [Pyrinomonadaceae bacterium]